MKFSNSKFPWLLSRAFILAFCFSTALPPVLLANPTRREFTNFEAMQAADILGIRSQVERYLSLQKGDAREDFENELLSLKSLIIRKILLGFVQVRQSSNKTDIELTYAYDVLYKEGQKESRVFDALNLLNFSQLAVLYSVAPYNRINEQFIQSSILGEVQAGLGITLPVISILYGKYFSFKKKPPPSLLRNSMNGDVVDATNLPPLITKFLDSSEFGDSNTRRQSMFEFWKRNYGIDPSDKSSLTSLNDDKRGTLGMLNKRIVLLWSLRNEVQAFDHELMALSNLVKTPHSEFGNETLSGVNINENALEAARLLKLESAVATLIELNKHHDRSKKKQELDAAVLERVLNATMDVRIATDKIDQELHYSYDIALADLLSRRAKAMQRNFEVNFIQTGTMVAIAKLLFLKKHAKSANQLLVISSGVCNVLSGLGIYLDRGGHRVPSPEPNSLAEFMELDLSKYSFSPLMRAFLNQPSAESNTGETRKEFLLSLWKKQHVSRLSTNKERNRIKLAAMPGSKYDSIKILTDRVALLSSLKANLEFFDQDLFELIKATDAEPLSPNTSSTNAAPSDESKNMQTAHLLGVNSRLVGRVSAGPGDSEFLNDELRLTRKALEAILDVRVTVDKLDLAVVREVEIRDRMVRSRDRAVAITNNVDFFQIGILGEIDSGPLAHSGQRRYRYYGDVGNFVSGLLVAGLTGAAFLEGGGGYRPNKPFPNMLSQMLGLETSADLQFSPLIWKFLNTKVPGTAETRRDQLVNYWKSKRMLSSGDGIKKSEAEKLAANGPAHHWWNERIGMIDHRLRMLYLLRSTVDLFDVDISDLLISADR